MHEHITGSEYEYMIWNWYLSIELFTIILNIFIYKITFWALSMILSNKRVLEKLQKQVDDTLGNTPGNLIKSSVWCTSTVVLGSDTQQEEKLHFEYVNTKNILRL